MGIGVLSDAHQKFFRRALEFRLMGIGILPRGEQPRNTLKARKGMVAFNRKGAKAAERRSKSICALQCLPKAVSVCSVAKRRKGTLLGSGGAQEGGGRSPTM